MIAYVDSSVVLRIAFQESNPLREWPEIRAAVSSELLVVEVRRSLDRLWLRNEFTEAQFAVKVAEAESLLARITHMELDRSVLDRAARSFPTPVSTLDAIHLATAMLRRAAHDAPLARAARAMQFEVIGA